LSDCKGRPVPDRSRSPRGGDLVRRSAFDRR
jgi:hypothetical protein